MWCSLVDAEKGIRMLNSLSIPVLSVVCNMAYFICDSCDKRHELFGNPEATQRLAELSAARHLLLLPFDVRLNSMDFAGSPSRDARDSFVDRFGPEDPVRLPPTSPVLLSWPLEAEHGLRNFECSVSATASISSGATIRVFVLGYLEGYSLLLCFSGITFCFCQVWQQLRALADRVARELSTLRFGSLKPQPSLTPDGSAMLVALVRPTGALTGESQ